MALPSANDHLDRHRLSSRFRSEIRGYDLVAGDSWVCQGTLGEGAITQISPDGETVEVMRFPSPAPPTSA